MIVSLAGHVDHGKTSLVNALTGVMTDRLKEEAERGLTIDLGFAYIDNAADKAAGSLGFVDVPGHHRFIHNMVAGISAQQVALLVIAADDGPMPQTREHLQIMQVLGLQQGVVALTKIDRVDAPRLAAAKEEIAHLLKDSFLDGAPIIEVSSITGDGVDTLLKQLQQAEQRIPPSQTGGARLAIDRAFVLKGQGVVVTGTLRQGQLAVGDDLHLFPSGDRVKVRSLHAQNKSTEQANAGDRCAVNITGTQAEAVQRGHWLTANPPVANHSLCVQLNILSDYPRALKHWSSVHIYHGTSHSIGQVALLEAQQGAPGATLMADLVLTEPLNAKRGDRLVLRDHGQDCTIGGAVVLDNEPPAMRRRAASRLERIASDLSMDAAAHTGWLLANGGVNLTAFANLWDITSTEVSQLLANQDCTTHAGFAYATSAIEKWTQSVSQSILNSDATDGLRRNEVQQRLEEQSQPVPDTVLSLVLDRLVADKQVKVQDGRYQAPQATVSLSDAEQTLLDLMTSQLDVPQPPSLGDICKRTGRDLGQLKRSLKSLGAKKQLVIVSETRVFLPQQYFELAELAKKIEPFTVREFRDASGLGRNVVIDVLENLDAKGYTRRNDDKRNVVGDLARLKG